MGVPHSEPAILLESGSHVLLEDAMSDLLLEEGASSSGAGILLESGSALLLEDGVSDLDLEGTVAASGTFRRTLYNRSGSRGCV
jgi:hypothetical protein